MLLFNIYKKYLFYYNIYNMIKTLSRRITTSCLAPQFSRQFFETTGALTQQKIRAMLGAQKSYFLFIPDITVDRFEHVSGHSPRTLFINSETPCLHLAQRYQFELLQKRDEQTSLMPLCEIFETYQLSYERLCTQALQNDIEEFHQALFPQMSSMDCCTGRSNWGGIVYRENEDLIKQYNEAYAIYKKNPKSFYAYYRLSLIINDLLNITNTHRCLSSYINDFISKRGASKFKLKGITYNNDRPSAEAHYDPNTELLNFSDQFFKASLSSQAFTTLHEIKHTAQLPAFDPFSAAEAELGADMFAASELSCEVCLKMHQLTREKEPISQPGYFRSYDFNYWIALRKDSRCTAHCCDTKELEQAIQDKQLSRAAAIDRTMGTLLNRLPDVHK